MGSPYLFDCRTGACLRLSGEGATQGGNYPKSIVAFQPAGQMLDNVAGDDLGETRAGDEVDGWG